MAKMAPREGLESLAMRFAPKLFWIHLGSSRWICEYLRIALGLL